MRCTDQDSAQDPGNGFIDKDYLGAERNFFAFSLVNFYRWAARAKVAAMRRGGGSEEARRRRFWQGRHQRGAASCS